MNTTASSPPGYVEVTQQALSSIGVCEQLLERVQLLWRAEAETTSVMKRVAEGTKPTYAQGKPYYRAGFGWRSSKAMQHEQRVRERITHSLPIGSVVRLVGGEELTVLHYRITPSWHDHPHSLEAITWELSTQHPLHLATVAEAGARFFAPTTPDEPTN